MKGRTGCLGERVILRQDEVNRVWRQLHGDKLDETCSALGTAI